MHSSGGFIGLRVDVRMFYVWHLSQGHIYQISKPLRLLRILFQSSKPNPRFLCFYCFGYVNGVKISVLCLSKSWIRH